MKPANHKIRDGNFQYLCGAWRKKVWKERQETGDWLWRDVTCKNCLKHKPKGIK